MVTPQPRSGEWASMRRVLMAAVLLFAQLIAPGLALRADQAQAGRVLLAAGTTICHADGTGAAPASPDPAGPVQHDQCCLLCVSCGFAGQAALPGSAVDTVRPPPVRVAHAPRPTPDTPPAQRIRIATPATGPPAHLA